MVYFLLFLSLFVLAILNPSSSAFFTSTEADFQLARSAINALSVVKRKYPNMNAFKLQLCLYATLYIQGVLGGFDPTPRKNMVQLHTPQRIQFKQLLT